MSQMRDVTPSNRCGAVQHSHGSSLASLLVTVGVTCSWPLGATEHGTRRTEDCSCLIRGSIGEELSSPSVRTNTMRFTLLIK